MAKQSNDITSAPTQNINVKEYMHIYVHLQHLKQ